MHYGKKRFILGEGDTAMLTYGFQTLGTYTLISPDAADAVSSEDQLAIMDMVLEHTMDFMNPNNDVAFTNEQDTKRADLATTINTFVQENLTKFLIGQKELSEWDAFQSELSEMDIDGLLALYEEAYNA